VRSNPRSNCQELGKLGNTGQLLRRQVANEFREREGVTSGFGEQPRTHQVSHSRSGSRLEQQRARCVRERAQMQRRQPVEGPEASVRIAHRYQQADPVCVEPARHEGDGISTLPVQPLRVVDKDEQGPSRRSRSGDQSQCRETGEKQIGGHVVTHPEGSPKGARLRPRQRPDGVEER
jgi:hypothetical protein